MLIKDNFSNEFTEKLSFFFLRGISREMRDGTCDRGKHKTASDIPSKKNDKQQTDIRGPICTDSIADV